MRSYPIAAIMVCMLAPCFTHAASFDCAKAGTPVEKMICGNSRLSELDEHLGRYYGAARDALGRAQSCLATTQREWLRGVRNACKEAACLERAYLARLAELDPLQPGMTAIKNIDLPKGKALAWVIPPAEDEVAAPRDPKRPPLVLAGRILDESAEGDGFVLQDSAGGKHVLLALMFIDKSSGVALETLSRQKDASFEARGQRETSSDGVAHFSPGACTFIHRLPR